MKVWLTSLDSKTGTNPMVQRMFCIPEFEMVGKEQAEVVILSFNAPSSAFRLAEAIQPGTPVIIIDTSETFSPNFILGADELGVSPYECLSEMLKRCRVKAYFKREYLRGYPLPADFRPPVYPLDWVLQTNSAPPTDTPEQFHARPIDIFMSWGYSNEVRPRFMGELLKQAGRFNAHFCMTEQDLDRALEEKRERIFALLHTPHYRRINIAKLMSWQSQAKISVSLSGAGRKCFRDGEASYNCVMARQSPHEVEWSYPWIHGFNCIGLNIQDPDNLAEAVETLWNRLRVCQGTLYDIYTHGMENNKFYWAETYSREWLYPRIRLALA